MGRNAKAHNVLATPEQLARKNVDLVECDRGGDVTFHGPGQLVAYPIFDLRRLPSTDPNRMSMGVVEFVRSLEDVLIKACANVDIPTQRISGLTGVWTERPTPSKIAAIGIHVSRGVTSHGFALNISTDLSYFDLIIPCGITSRSVTSIQKELGRSVSIPVIAEVIIDTFGRVFHSKMLQLSTLDELISPMLGLPLKTPSCLRHLHKEDETFLA